MKQVITESKKLSSETTKMTGTIMCRIHICILLCLMKGVSSTVFWKLTWLWNPSEFLKYQWNPWKGIDGMTNNQNNAMNRHAVTNIWLSAVTSEVPTHLPSGFIHKFNVSAMPRNSFLKSFQYCHHNVMKVL